jgi:hypothetical protein
VKYICPLCNHKTDFFHILKDHEDFWDNAYPTDNIPDNVEDFNKRFDLVGLHIQEVEE